MLKPLFSRSRLGKALLRNDPKLLLKVIKAGTDLNQPLRLPADPDSQAQHTPVEQALRLQHPRCLQLLLEAGAELPRPRAGAQPLLSQAIAAPDQALELTHLLLQAGADPNVANGEPLFCSLAVADDNRALLLLNRLLQYGADLNAHRRQGRSLLAQLLLEQRTLLVGALISSGAELPDDLGQLDCSDQLKQFARRKAEDLKIQRQLQGL